MDMSPRTSLEDNAGYSEICEVLRAVLLQHHAGLKVTELRAILMRTRQIDLESLRKELGFGNMISFLAQLPDYRLLYPELHGNCIITYAPKSDLNEKILSVLTDPMFASGIRLFKLAEILNLDLGINLEESCRRMGYKHPMDLLSHVPNVRLMDPSKEEDCVVRFQPGYQDEHNGISPGRSIPDTTTSPDKAYSINPVDTERWTTPKEMQRPPPKRNSSDLNEKILSVLTDPMFASGIRLFKLAEILNLDLGIDLEGLCRGMGYKHPVDLLCHVPNVRLMDPSRGEDCVVRFQPGRNDPVYNHQSSEKHCWFEDSFPDNFLSSTSPSEVHQASPEKTSPPHHKAPATGEVGCTALQLEATVYSSTQHPGYQDGDNGISPGRSIPDTTTSPDKAYSVNPVDTERFITTKDMQIPPPKRNSSDINEKILSVLTDPMFSSGIRLFKLAEILNLDLGLDLEGLCWGMGYKHPLDLLCHVPNVRLVDPSRGEDCVVRFQPGIDEELFSVLSQPMFASGIRLFKLAEILNVEHGIHLEELCWRLGYKHPLDMLRNVPNVRLVDPSRGQDCVVRFQPGFKGNERNFFLHKMALPPVTNPGQQLKTELNETTHNYEPHDCLYPVPLSSSKRQVPNSSENGTNNISKNLPKVGPPYPQNTSKGASVTVYASKYHQKFGQPQQKVKPGSTMVFHASKTSVFVGPLNSYTTKTCATESTFYMPYQNMDPFSNTVYPSQKHSTINPKEQRVFQLFPSNEPPVHSNGDSSSMIEHADSPFFHPSAEEKGIDPVLKDEILVVLLQQPDGVAFGEFAGLFHRTHGYQLKICYHGYMSLRALLDEMADLVTIGTDPNDPLIKCRGHHHYVCIGGGHFSTRI